MIQAVVNRRIKNDFRPNALTIVEKYRFNNEKDARQFAKSIREIDARIVSIDFIETD